MRSKVRSGGRTAPRLPSGRSALALAWPRLFAVVLLACLLAQGTLVQSHLHFRPPAHALAFSGGPSSQLSKAPPGDTTADCPLCHEAAMAGAYLLPAATILPPAPPATPWLVAAPLAAFGLPSPAFGWLSRAPPQ